MNENIKKVKQGVLLRRKLKDIGICSLVGPTGPRGLAGTSISIKGNFASYDELKNSHPTGNLGDAYLVNGNLYLWNDDNMVWENVGNIKGPKGDKGDIGEKGDIGPTGPQGIIGMQGPKGDIGPKGDKGEKGDTGEKGEPGIPGQTGKQGVKGDKGDTGPTGPKGDTGEKGDIGPIGLDGKQGEKGDKGGVDAFGEKYLHTNKTISVKQFVDTVIPLDDNNASFNTEYNTQNAIDIKKVGLYKVDYFISFTPSEDINYSIFIKTDSSILPGSDVTKSAKSKEATYLYGSVIGMFAIYEFVSLYIKTNKDVNLSFGDTTSAKLIITKLD